uniref:Uncharacterized protein n=1 Tax=Catharus ustulatus TaxID=91951 RepID=A0A8C3UP91_CATUS
VADSGPAEQGAPHLSGANGAAKSNSFSQHMLWFSFFQIVQSGRLIVATMCGHLFCSGCLPVALETVGNEVLCVLKVSHLCGHLSFILVSHFCLYGVISLLPQAYFKIS